MVAVMFLHVGCIFPTDIEEPPPNRAPQIDRKTIQPGEYWNVLIDMDCKEGQTLFKIGSIEDKDPVDTLYIRWFFDYYTDYKFYMKETQRRPGEGDTWPLDYNSVYIKNSERDSHVVEVIVTDRPFNDSGAPQDRAIADGAGDDHFLWYLIEESDGICPEEISD